MDALIVNAEPSYIAKSPPHSEPLKLRPLPSASCLCGMILLLSLLPAVGCKTFSQRGPVPESVATCRQLSQRGVVAMEKGQWEQAEILLAQAVSSCETNEEARRHYAEALWHRGAHKLALEQMETAIKLSNADAALHCKMGEMYLVMQDWPRAEKHAAQALQLDVHSASAWALRGKIHHALGRSPQALADLQRAMAYAPEDPEILLAVAELQRQASQPQRALVTLLALADLYPPGEEPQQVLYLTGLALSAVGRNADAAEHLYAASLRGQPSAEILYRLAEAELLSGRPEAAEANALQALQLNPQHVACHGLVERLSTARAARVAGRPY